MNVSHGTIYRYYPSKTALKEAVTERWLKEQVSAPLQSL
ncbi:TetR/AcrR family transcriptional regulator [Bacillus sp. YC2]|nr:TetR/AcrR family transcriptional regulator [Bacillus sp. YC2]